MTDALKNIRTRERAGETLTPQTEKAAKGQKKNSAGGYTFTVGDMDRALRFLILGSDSSFYSSAVKMSKDNAKVIFRLAETNSRELVDLIVDVSTQGRAPKQNPGLFALAVACSVGADDDRAYALSKLSEVARTASTLFLFITYVTQFRGWGRGLRRAVSNWYTERSVKSLAYQMVKYRSREGYSHADVTHLAHPARSKTDEEFKGLMEWAHRGKTDNVPAVVVGFELAKTASVENLPDIIRSYDLSWEMVPSDALNDKRVWEALLEGNNLPLGALIRNLPKLTRVGIVGPMSKHNAGIVARLTDQSLLAAARIHPMNILVALKTYAGGYSLRGTESWTPEPKIVDALDRAFYLAFQGVEPANKRTLIALDVSGSMGWGNVAGLPITPAEAVGALSLVMANVEPQVHTVAFSTRVVDIGISPGMRLDDVSRAMRSVTMGGTDTSAAVQYAIDNRLAVDTFIVMTDNETWAGRHGHTHEVLARYRAVMGIEAKLIVLSTEATPFSIADPNDPGMLDIAGLDLSVPQVITAFSRGL